ncbi:MULTISPECIES: hypothetical protein [Streptomyces]|uniref:Integral membrane protein n=1 Tax=Streptomyces mordarskii TaxID=1226758 RepID=A0ABN1EMK1_9ACTN|nr:MULTISPECIES: hypothetical protein [unclassified Streptomyces]AJZ84328.1 hypothetical protein AS97_20785 [Streptomyces sp. AgN23]RSS36956.1 hypothetical protein EF902_33985 [Streptomyces sp. WAC05858]WTA78973.1 hypothetical protein OG751_02710 [Streptomyces antimycoticus]WTB10697.1 hypothetical protein OG546_45080 [Streptomyces antimycoticus]
MDTTKTDQSTDTAVQPAEGEEATAEGAPNAVADPREAPDLEEASDDLGPPPPATTPSVVPGAAAVVGAGLGLASLSGTWLGTMLQERKQLTGQIKAQSGAAADQIATVYGTPWHTTALVNGLFALAAVVIAGVVLLRRQRPVTTGAPWVAAVAWGAVALGVIGLLIAAAMGLDIFSELPKVPASPNAPAG